LRKRSTTTKKKIYLIGALANPEIPHFANRLRKQGFEVFDQWWAPGKFADSYWRNYTKIRGMSYKEALNDYAARHIFEFDVKHLRAADIAVLLAPAGKSAHLELGWHLRGGKPGYILFPSEPRRYDVMIQFCTDYFFKEKDLFTELRRLG
jgi:hypothetical protein